VKPFYVTLVGGPYDGEQRAIHEGSSTYLHEPSGVVNVYRRSEVPGQWKYDLEASTVATLRQEQKRRDARGPSE